jgi:serine/threonine protein kinase
VNALDGGHLVGRYRIVKFLGAGAMGEVYLADDPQIDRRLAIKTVRLVGRPQEIEDRKKRLLREARAAGRLLHPNVVTLFDAGEAEGMLYLAFEYVEGTDLAQRLEGGPSAGGQARLSLRQVLRVVRQVADALDYAHGQGIVHRDIKPSNILLDLFGRVKVADFGIAKMAGQSTELTMAGSVMGSPQYLSPEQIRGEDLDGRSDIFSLGVVLYEILSGKRPFEGETITTLVYQILHKDPPPVSELRAIPPRLEELLRRMLAKSAGDRLATGGEAARELAAIEAELSDETLSAPAGALEELDATRILPRRTTGVEPAAAISLGTVPASPGTTPSVRASTVAASLPTASQPVAQIPQAAPPASAAIVPPVMPPAPAPSLVAAAAARKPLPVGLLIGVLLLVMVGALGVGGWMFWQSRQAGAEALQAAQQGTGTAGTQTSLEAPPAPAAPSPSGAAPAPSVMPPAMPAAAPAPVTPSVSSAPAAAIPRQVPPPPVSAPRSSPPANVPPAAQERPIPRSQSPERAPVHVPVPAPVPAAPEREAEPAAAPSERVDRSMRTGMEVTFNVQPEDAHVLVDGRVIGEAQDWNGQHGARTYTFADPGSHVIKIRKPGLKEYRVAVEAGAVGGKTPITAHLQSMVAEEVDASDLQTVRVREAVAFRLQPSPPTAEVRVDGQLVGLARRFGGGGFLRAKEWLELSPGKHRISIVSPGFRRKDLLVEVVATAERDRERIDVAMTAGGSGE